ncbi:MAG TPA: hypothetical protein VM580_01940 [Labilithrix sp.]|jgi:hypothetical protein|nr:hypothetical protein [Labilithrix sp.]
MTSLERCLMGLGLACVLLASCKPKELAGTDKLDLARSMSTTVAPSAKDFAGHVVAYSASGGVAFDGAVLVPPSRVSNGRIAAGDGDKESDPNDLLIVPLRGAMTNVHEREGGGKASVIAVERTTPYRIVAQIAYSLVDVDPSSPLGFLVQNDTGRTVLRIQPRKMSEMVCKSGPFEVATDEPDGSSLLAALGGLDAGVPLPVQGSSKPLRTTPHPRRPLGARDDLCLTFHVHAGGIDVRSQGEMLDATCTQLSSDDRTTLPSNGSNVVDARVISSCLTNLVTRFSRALVVRPSVSAAGTTSFQEVVSLLDRIREAKLDPVLGAPR